MGGGGSKNNTVKTEDEGRKRRMVRPFPRLELLVLLGLTALQWTLRMWFSGVYFCLNMVMITMSTVLSCVVANMFFRGVRINRAPRWIRVVSARAPRYCHITSVSSALALLHSCQPSGSFLFFNLGWDGVRFASDLF